MTLARARDRRKIRSKEKAKLLDRLCELNPEWRSKYGTFVNALRWLGKR